MMLVDSTGGRQNCRCPTLSRSVRKSGSQRPIMRAGKLSLSAFGKGMTSVVPQNHKSDPGPAGTKILGGAALPSPRTTRKSNPGPAGTNPPNPKPSP